MKIKAASHEEKGYILYKAHCPFCGKLNWVEIPLDSSGGDGNSEYCKHLNNEEMGEYFTFEYREVF